jgi:hypothetical protein
MRILQREDVVGVRIGLASDQDQPPPHVSRELDLSVKRVHLYLFDTQVAILVVEVVRKDIDLGDVQEIQDRFRRVYPPYWEEKQASGGITRVRAGHCPESVQWLDEDGHAIGPPADYDNAYKHRAFVQKNRRPPITAHWEWLLQPLVPQTAAQTPEDRLAYRQIEDERLPTMCYLAVDNPQGLTEGDFIRLAFVDGRGTSDTLPYATAFVAYFKQDYCYDRFWDPGTPAHAEWMSTRYLCCGYAFTMIGKYDTSFFANPSTGALAHFRHHYLQMGLIAHFHRASLLMFSDRLSHEVAQLKRSALRGAFRTRVQRLQIDLLDFISRYWFTEISNQVQARELFALWSKHLGTQELYQDVMHEIRTVNEVLDTMEQGKQSQITLRLTVVATTGLAMVLTTSFFGMGIANRFKDGVWSWPSSRESVFILVVFVAFSCLLTFIILISGRLSRALDDLSQENRRWTERIGSFFKTLLTGHNTD